jgi:hypothetical protein
MTYGKQLLVVCRCQMIFDGKEKNPLLKRAGDFF